MQLAIPKKIACWIATCFLLPPFLLINAAVCQVRSDCEESFKVISRAYNNGEWNNAKNSSIDFINGGLSDYCKDFTPLVYNYLIQSFLRLYNIDSARTYYFNALKNDYKIILKPGDEKMLRQGSDLKIHSVNLYAGVISSDIREVKFGLAYGLTPRIFVETSFNNRHFGHISGQGDGVMGKPLIMHPGIFPHYKFQIKGYEQYIEMAAFYKHPVVSRRDVNILYITAGCFITYYLKSHVNTWQLQRYDSAGQPTQAQEEYSGNQRFEHINALGISMDLKRLYRDRLNCGVFGDVGSSIRMKNLWELFFELKVAVGKNNMYRYSEFSTYKPGVDYFFLVVGITKKIFKVKKEVMH